VCVCVCVYICVFIRGRVLCVYICVCICASETLAGWASSVSVCMYMLSTDRVSICLVIRQ
jgi:hypothetical protein